MNFLNKTCIAVFLVWMLPCTLYAQRELEVLRGWIQYSDAPNSLYHHIADEAYDLLEQRSKKVASLTTRSAWLERQQWIRKTLTAAVGAFPAKTPLNARIVRTIDKDQFRMEHIIYESQPGNFVTASLFIPSAVIKTGKAPVIIYCSGHSATGYRSYQKTLLNLVNKGFIVFAFDPLGQGERSQYVKEGTNKSSFRWPAWEHSYVGAQLFINGNTLARDFIWDGIRAIDYLETRREVDTARIGITGRSGGGTQSAYIAAFDARIKAMAPENYITSFKKLFESIGPQDAEQDFFYGIQRGLDMADLLAVRAPKPVLMITTSQDMFPIQGAMETASEMEKVYRIFGRPGNFSMVSDDAPHASTLRNREAMYAFFQKFLNNPGDPKDEDPVALTPEELQVTTTGQVVTALQSETAYSQNRKDALHKMQTLEVLRKKYGAGIPGLAEKAGKLSGYQKPATLSAPQFMGRFQREGYTIEKYILRSNGYVIPYLLFGPEKKTGKGAIYLHPSGKFADTASDGMINWLVEKGIMVLVPDLPGMGELGPGAFRGDSFIDSVSYNMWFASILTGNSIVGIQAADVVRLVRTMKERHGITEVTGMARQQMAPVLLHAAALSTGIDRMVLVSPYSSYRSFVMNPEYEKRYLHSTVAGAIGQYDLPDLAAAFAPRPLLIVGVTDANGKVSADSDVDTDVIRTAYAKKQGLLRIEPSGTREELYRHLSAWMDMKKNL